MKKELSWSFVLLLQQYLKLTPASADLIGSKFEYLKFALQGTCPYKVYYCYAPEFVELPAIQD